MIQVVEDCLQFRGRVVHHYALMESDQITLIDGGFLTSTPERLARQLESIGRNISEIKTVLVTHDHIDHTLHLSSWQELTGAKIYAPALDQNHVSGTYPYTGLSRIFGWMEAAARTTFRYRASLVDCWFSPGEILPIWGGLEVIPLPGHTLGHVGFYSQPRKLLFAGDLFANFHYLPKPPPSWFNVNSKELIRSIQRATELNTSGGILLNHCHGGSPLSHRSDLFRLARRLG